MAAYWDGVCAGWERHVCAGVCVPASVFFLSQLGDANCAILAQLAQLVSLLVAQLAPPFAQLAIGVTISARRVWLNKKQIRRIGMH